MSTEALHCLQLACEWYLTELFENVTFAAAHAAKRATINPRDFNSRIHIQRRSFPWMYEMRRRLTASYFVNILSKFIDDRYMIYVLIKS